MLQAFVRDVHAGRAGLIRAARRAYLLGLVALALPGVVLGGLLVLVRPLSAPLPAVLLLVVLSVALSLVALRMAHTAAKNTELPARQAALTAAIQAATAPGVPLLLACALLSEGLAAGLFVVLAVGMHALVWWQLPGWVREPEG